MPSLQRIYGEAVHKNFSTYYANFPPDAEVGIGDYGLFPDRTFHRLGGMENDFRFLADSSPANGDTSLEFKSKTGVAVATSALAEANVGPLGKKADAKIAFSKAMGIFFSAAGCRTTVMRNETALHREILGLFAKDQWNPAWVVVTGTITSKALTLLTSSDGGAEIELSTDVDGPFDFADLNVAASLRVVRESGIEHKLIGRSGTPLLRLAALRRKYRIAGNYEVKVSLVAEEPPENLIEARDRILEKGGRLEDEFDFGRLDETDENT